MLLKPSDTYAKKHKMYGVNSDVSILPNEIFLSFSTHAVRRVAETSMFEKNLSFY